MAVTTGAIIGAASAFAAGSSYAETSECEYCGTARYASSLKRCPGCGAPPKRKRERTKEQPPTPKTHR